MSGETDQYILYKCLFYYYNWWKYSHETYQDSNSWRGSSADSEYINIAVKFLKISPDTGNECFH